MTDTATAAPAGKIQPRLKQKYQTEISAQLKKDFGFTNVHQVPGLVKIVVNTGVGEAARDGKIIDGAVKDLTAITGQKPQVTSARKSGPSRSAPTSPSAATGPGSSWTACSRSRFPASVTSAACPTSSSTVTATTPSVSTSSRCSTRSIRTRSTGFVVSTSPSSRRPGTTTRVARCSRRSASRSAPQRTPLPSKRSTDRPGRLPCNG